MKYYEIKVSFETYKSYPHYKVVNEKAVVSEKALNGDIDLLDEEIKKQFNIVDDFIIQLDWDISNAKETKGI